MNLAIGASAAVDLCDSSAVDRSTLTLPRAEVAGSAVSGAFDPRRPWLNPSHRIGEQLLQAAGCTLDQQLAGNHLKLTTTGEAAELLAQLDQAEHERELLVAQAERGRDLDDGTSNKAWWACDPWSNPNEISSSGLGNAPEMLQREYLIRLLQAKGHNPRNQQQPAQSERAGTCSVKASTPPGQSERPSARSHCRPAPRSRRGRPRKNAEIPGIYGNRQLDRALIRAGLTPTERTIARKILSLLRAEYTQHQRGKFIQRSSLGSDRTVKRVFSKLRAAQLITDSRPVKGQNQTRITNLGPVFLAGLRGQPDGPKLAPQNPNFDTPKTLANTGEVHSNLAPRFRNPLKRVPMGAGPTASAPLRAAASRPAPSETHQQQINPLQSHSESTSSLPANPIQSKPTQGSTVLIQGREGRFIVKGFSWGDSSDQDSVRCVSVESSDTWITAKMSDVTVVS
jgi:hypothetical protein